MSTTKNKVLVFMLAFLMVFTAIPPSYASDEVVKIETLTARLVKGASKIGDDWVWKATGNSAGHRFVYRVTYAISGTREYEPGKVEIRIPKQVLLDRENNFADSYEMSIPSYDDPELTEDNTTKYVYKEDGDDIVIYNRIAVPGGDNGYFEVGYDMSKRTFEYADYGADSDESGPFKATMKISQGETTATKDTDETYVYIDTGATINRTTKSASAKYNSWSDSWGEAPADADDYYYIVWQVRTWINTPTQPYNFRIVDTFDQTVEGEVVGYRYQGESSFTDNHWVQKQTHYSENDRYDYVLTKYSKAQFVDVDYYELKNNVVATVDPYDEVDPDTTAYSNAAYRWEKPKYVKPTGHFGSEKRGNDYRDSYVYSSDDIRSFKLTDFQKEKINRIDNLKYSTWTVGYQWPWTLQGDWQNPDNYGKKNVKTVIWDNEWYLNKTDGSEYEESEKLTKDDFELKKITFNWSASSATFNEETQGFSQVTPTYTTSDYVDFYGEFNGTWQRVARYNPGTGTFSNLASSYYLKSASGNTIEFGANCTGWKAEYSNKFFRVELAVNPYVDLKDSAKVKEECAEKDKVSLLNVMHSEMYDSGNNKIVDFTKKGTDYIIGINKHGHIGKYVNSYKNNKVKKNYSVNWRMNAWEDFRDANAAITDVAQESGVFYDLVPLGGEVNLSSVKAYKAKSNFSNGENVVELDSSDYDVEIKKNYKDSGRDLLIVKIKTEGEKGYQVRYTSVHSWESIKDTGNVFLNEVAYETGNEDMGDAGPDNGGSLSSKDIMTNLNPDVPDSGNAEKFMYASATHTANILTSANLGLLKKVKDSSDEDYSYKTITKPNGDYSYKIRFTTDDETRARDLMLFDSLENYVVQEAGQNSHTSDWHGKLQSVDLSVVRKLGIAPVVYLSSVENLDLSVAANHDLSNSAVWKKADQFGNIENAKAVAVDMRYKADGSEYILPKDTGVSVTLNMKAPEGLEIDKEHIYAFNNIYLNDIAIDANDTEEHFYVHQDYTQIEYRVSAPVKITKVNAKDHSEKVKDMTFNLTGTSDYGTEVNETKKSGDNGYVDFEGIEKGTYILKETKTNDDWLLNGQAYTVNIDYRGNVNIEGLEKESDKYLFENKPRIHGDLQFRKKSLGTDWKVLNVINQIKNAERYDYIQVNNHRYFVFDKNNEEAELVIELANGNPSINSNYAIECPYEIRYDSNRQIAAYKDSEIRDLLNNEVFNLIDTEVSSIIKEKTNISYAGTSFLSDLQSVVKTTSKDRVYLLSTVWRNSRVNSDGDIDLDLISTSQNKSLVEQLINGQRLSRNIDENFGNRYTINAIRPGSLMYCDAACPVSPIGMTVDLRTTPQLNIPNTTFKLEGTSDYGTEVTEYLTSNSVGRVTLENLEKGTYTLTETNANPDYIKNPDTWKVIVDENGQVTVDGAKTLENGEQYLENEPYHQMNLRKVDADDSNRWLEGAEFSLTGTSNYGTKVDMTDTSRNTGRVTFDMLESGTYVLKETKPPKNYQADAKEYLVEIDKNGNVTIDGLSEVDDDEFILFPNEKSFEGKIKITKKWKDGKTGEEAANRPEPVITISTKEEDAFKGHVLTYDANGKTFANGKSTNRVRVFQQSGDKIEDSIVDGTYKEPVDPSEEYEFKGWYFDKECTQPMVDTAFLTQDRTVYAKWEEKPHLKYAVAVYGIGVDQVAKYDVENTEDTANGTSPVETETAGLTFGPALGADYTQSYKSHEATGQTENGNAHRCVHNDDWDTIIEWNNRDPWVYEQCVEEGCTHSLKLNALHPIATYNYFEGQGRSAIWDLITGDGVSAFSFESSSYMYQTSLNEPGWGGSRARAILNGVDDLTDFNFAGSEETFSVYDGNTFCDLLPQKIRTVVGSREVKYETNSTKQTYDKAWLLSTNEIWDEEQNNETPYAHPTEGTQYACFANQTENATSDQARTIPYSVSRGDVSRTIKTYANSTLVRSIVNTSRYGGFLISFSGGLKTFGVGNSACYSPCFSLKRTQPGANASSKITAKEGDNKTANLTSKKDNKKTLTSKTVTNKPGTTDNPVSAIPKLSDNPLSALTDEAKAAEGDIASGNYYGADWRVTSEGVLEIGNIEEEQTITGIAFSYPPWHDYRDTINEVKFVNIVHAYKNSRSMFSDFSATNYDFTYFDTADVESMNAMFSGATLNNVIWGDFTTENVTDMTNMFANVTADSLDLSFFNTEKVKRFYSMFSRADIDTLNISSFSTDALTRTESGLGPFLYASSYSQGVKSVALGKNFDISNIDLSRNYMLTRYATLDGRNVYDEEEINIFDYDGSKPGWYKVSNYTAPNESELYDGYSTADDQSKWVKESDDTWTYTFDVHDDEAKYYVWEELLEGYDSDTYKIDYQIINDPDNPDVNVKEATITNTQENIPPEREEAMPGSLKLSKTVAGETTQVDLNKDFAFNVELGGLEGTKIVNGVVFKEGKGTVHLKHGEEFELTDLPAGTTYKVTEADQDDYNVTFENNQGTINGNKTVTAAFTNTKKTVQEQPRGGFKLTKQVKGNLGDLFENFTFNIAFSKLSANAEYEFSDGSKFTSDENGMAEAEVKLKSGDEVTIDGLPVGAKYKVTELRSRYTASYEITEGTGRTDSIVQPKDSNDELWVSLSTRNETVDEDEDITVKFTNTREKEPTTGYDVAKWWLYALILLLIGQMYVEEKYRRRFMVRLHD